MPTFDEYDQSVEDNAPVELYKFVGSFKTYRYTSADDTITFAAEQYLPIAVTRSRVRSGTQDDDNLSLDLAIPFDIDVVQDYAFAEVPPSLNLTIYRVQDDDPTAWRIFWMGKVHGFSVNERLATVQVPSLFQEALSGELPSVFYQVPCNHTLYDAHCQVVRAVNTFAGVVQAVDSTEVSLVGVPTTNGNLVAGEILNLRNGERRKIFANVGTLITIGYPFVDILPGDDVELVRGCNHLGRTGDCHLKFDNYDNYGGFEDIPPDNPFVGDVG